MRRTAHARVRAPSTLNDVPGAIYPARIFQGIEAPGTLKNVSERAYIARCARRGRRTLRKEITPAGKSGIRQK